MVEPTTRPGRAGLARVAGAGIASAALASVASAKPWFAAAVDFKLLPGVSDPDKRADMPLALALSLVVLAGWGALLVTRGRFRRAVAGVALLASLVLAGCVVAAPFTLPDQIRDRLASPGDDVSVSATGWYVAAAVAAVLCVLTLAEAWRRAPTWPTMSSRYDAPTTRPGAADETDLWKALDEGRDPTDPAGPASP